MSSSKEELKSKIESLRDNLIDLSSKNNFLNFNWYDDALPIIDVDFLDLFSRLVLENHEFELTFEKSIEELKNLLNDENLTDRIKIDAIKRSIGRIEKYNDTPEAIEYLSQNTLYLFKIPDYYIDRTNDFVLDTPLNKDKFNALIHQIDSKIEKDLFLEGIPKLFLALGFLEYDDSFAPLIFIPVVLEKRVDKFYIRYNSHTEIKLNQYLKLKLAEKDINLPLTDIKTDMDMINYLTNVNNFIPDEYNLKPFIALGLFDFTNLNLYEDLNIENLSESGKNELIYLLSDNNEGSLNKQSKIDDKNLDSISKRFKYNVCNVDSSQESIIEEAKLGGNILVDTHSATNKTEAITNLISNIIATKRTVLYITDKMEAMHEIKDKLDEIGLDIAYLDLYGINYNNSQLINEIVNSVNYNFDNFDKEYFNLKIKYTNQLNNNFYRYLDFIHSPYKKTGISPYDLLGLRESNLFEIEKKKKKAKIFQMENVSNINENELERIFDNIENILSIYAEKIAPASEHKFKDFNTDISEDDFSNILNLIPKLNKSIEKLLDLNGSIFDDYGVSELEKLDDMDEYFNNLEILEKNPNIMGGEKKELLDYISSLEDLQVKMNEYGTIEKLEESLTSELEESRNDLLYHMDELAKLKGQINDYNLTLNNFKENLNAVGVKKLYYLDEINDSLDKLALLSKNPSIVKNDESFEQFIDDIESYQKNSLKDLIKSIDSDSKDLLAVSLDRINKYLQIESSILDVNDLIIRFNNLKEDIGFIKLNSIDEINRNISISDLLIKKPALIREEDNLDQFYNDLKRGQDRFSASSYDEYYNSLNKEFADMQTDISKEVSKSSVLESKLFTILNELKDLKKCLDDLSDKTYTQKISCLKDVDEYCDNFNLFLMGLKPIEEKDKEEAYAYIQLIKEKQNYSNYFNYPLSDIEKAINNMIFIQKSLDKLNFKDTILKENLTQDLENFKIAYSKLQTSPIEINSYTRRNELKDKLNEFKKSRNSRLSRFLARGIKKDLENYYKYKNPQKDDDTLIKDFEDYFKMERNVNRHLLKLRNHDKFRSNNFYDDYERINNSIYKLINLKKLYLETNTLIAKYVPGKNYHYGALEELVLIKSKLEKANDISNMDDKLGKYFPNSYKRFDTNLNELYNEFVDLDKYNQLKENKFFEKPVYSLNIRKEELEDEIIHINLIKSKIYNNIKWINRTNNLKNCKLNFDIIFSVDFDDLIDYCENLYFQIKTSNDLFNENIRIKDLEFIGLVYDNLKNISSFEEIKFISDVSEFEAPLSRLKEDYELLYDFYSISDVHADLIQRYYGEFWDDIRTPLEDIEDRNKDCKEFTQLYGAGYFSDNIFRSFENSIEDELNALESLSNELINKIESFDKELIFYKGDLSKISFNDIQNQNTTIFSTFNSLKEYKIKLSSYDSDHLIKFKEMITVDYIDKIDDFEEKSEKYLSRDSINRIEDLSRTLEKIYNNSNINKYSILSFNDKITINNIKSSCKIFNENIILRNTINSKKHLIKNHFYHEDNQFNLWIGPLSDLDKLKEKIEVDKEFTKLFNENYFNDKTLELIDEDPNNFNEFLKESKKDCAILDSSLKEISQFDIINDEDFIKRDFNQISRKLKTVAFELIRIEEDFENINLIPDYAENNNVDIIQDNNENTAAELSPDTEGNMDKDLSNNTEENQNLFDMDICSNNIKIIDKISSYKFIKSIKDKSEILKNHKKSLNLNLNHLKELYALKNDFDAKDMDEKYFNHIFNSYDTDVSKLKEQIDINMEFEKLFNDGFFNSKIERILSDNEEYAKFNKKIDKFHDLIKEILYDLNHVDLLFNEEKAYFEKEFLELFDIINFLDENKSDLVDWRRFKIYANVDDGITNDFIKALAEDEIDKEIVYETFAYNFANNFLCEIESEDFNLTAKDMEDYKDLNNEIINLNKLRVLENLKENRPDFTKSTSQNESYKAYSYLNHEYNSRYKKSIREFLINTIDYVKFIKPIFLMNPNSVIEYLDHNQFDSYFDYVIFDDISNSNIENSLSSLLRAKNKIIFANGKIKSNLDLFNLFKSKFINKSLKWTNLDMDKSLLEFSNKRYYNDDLIFYETPEKNYDTSLKLKIINESKFDKESKVNVIEAEKIVDYAFDHFEFYANSKSLGIIAFTPEQKEFINNLILKRINESPEFSEYFNSIDKFFITDIDEAYQKRDIILISMTYGFDDESKLNIDIPFENEYLVNLVLTRSLEKTIIFSNFKSKDIIIKKDSLGSEKAIKDLFEYIDYNRLYVDDKFYAELNRDYINLEINKPELSLFENYIYDFLTNEGYIVKRQYGICGNYIDLVVADKENINRNLLAIICDKTNYEAFNTINDREIFNVNLLENLGWNHYHIYASEWYNNPVESKKNLLDALNRAIENKELSDFGVIVSEDDLVDDDRSEEYGDIELGDDIELPDDIGIDLGDGIELLDDVEIELEDLIELSDDVEIDLDDDMNNGNEL